MRIRLKITANCKEYFRFCVYGAMIGYLVPLLHMWFINGELQLFEPLYLFTSSICLLFMSWLIRTGEDKFGLDTNQ